MTHFSTIARLLVAMTVVAAGCGGVTPAPSSPSSSPTSGPVAAGAGTDRVADPDDNASARKALGGIAVAAPARWRESPPTSQMRRAQWSVGPDAARAELIVYYFGNAGAGSVDANLERWFNQFQQPDGRPSKDVAQVKKMRVADMDVTAVDVGGRYVAQLRPGSQERHDEPDWHMLAAIVAAPDGAYYFKLVGPSATVVAERSAFATMLASVGPAAGGGAHPGAAHPQPDAGN